LLSGGRCDGPAVSSNVGGWVFTGSMTETQPDPDEVGASSAHPIEPVLVWLERLEAQQRGIDASRMRLMAAAVDCVLARGSSGSRRGRELAYRALRAELSTALGLSERQTETQMDLAFRLAHHYPATLELIEAGALSLVHARVIVDAGALIGAGDADPVVSRRREYERRVLEIALVETPNRLKPIARRLAEQGAERALEERHREAMTERRVFVLDCEDGMADLVAHLPAIEAHAIRDRLTRIARAAERGERGHDERRGHDEHREHGERRSRDQLRADVLSDLLLAADERSLFAGSAAEAIRARVQVNVDASVLGLIGQPSSGPCELSGYGPVSPASARVVAAAASHWETVESHGQSGDVLSVERYRPSERMRRLLAARDQHCRFPGCRVPVHRCDLDHTVDAALGGRTATPNLAHLCRGHHTIKHHGGWRVAQEPRGVLRWTSPTGRTHLDRPGGWSGPP